MKRYERVDKIVIYAKRDSDREFISIVTMLSLTVVVILVLTFLNS